MAHTHKKLRGWKFLLHKTYFDKGTSITNYLKYPIGLITLASLSVKVAIISAVLYAVFCYIVGRLWYYYKLVETENEIGNYFNPFQREVREKLK